MELRTGTSIQQPSYDPAPVHSDDDDNDYHQDPSAV